MLKPMWDAKAVKAYESGQGVKLVSTPHPHYEPLPEDLNPESLETVEIDLPPQRTWVYLTDEEIGEIAVKSQDGISPHDDTLRFARAIEAAHGIKENT